MTERCCKRSGPQSPYLIIEPLVERPLSARDTQFQRRRLGLLVGLFLAVLAVAPVVARITASDPDVRSTVVAADAGDPVTLAGDLNETTSTLRETTTTAAPPATPAPSTVAPATVPPATDAPTTAPPVTAAATSVAPPVTPAPPTTAAPITAPPATVAATTTAPTRSELSYSDPRSTQVWTDLAECESHGTWDIDTGNGYYGGLQFSLGSWRSVGGTGYPHENPRATQIEMGRRLQARQGWAAWPHCSAELGLR